MAKKIKHIKPRETIQTKKTQVKSLHWYSDNSRLAVILGILLTTFFVYSPSLNSHKEFTNWDDPVYVVDQPLITQIDATHLKALFTEPVSLNYHPVTMLSLALNYYFSGLSPFGFFLTNIFFHLFNTFLVFIFLYQLSEKKFWVGAISALLFGIHPMHVESVAWISERKDLLYCFFFLTSCISYIAYIETKRINYIVLCFFLFVISCLSKAMAAPLPIVILLIDFYRQRKFSMKAVTEKIPFFVVSLVVGYMAVKIQSHGAIADAKVFTIPQRLMFASYGFIIYWVKFFVPTGLSAFYPYPQLRPDGDFGWSYKAAIIVAFSFVVVPAYVLVKRDKNLFRVFVFGMVFFIAMVAMVLQFISVGKAIMADRYTYLSYIGISFIVSSLVASYLENVKTKFVALTLVLIITAIFSFLSYARVQVWENSGSLWTDVISKYPYVIIQNGNVVTVVQVGVDDAYKNRGNFYREHGDMEKAMADYELLVRVKSSDEDAYSGLGNFYSMKGDLNKALELYSEALKLKPGKLQTYLNRSISYSNMGKHREALEDLKMALKLNPDAEASIQHNLAFEKLSLGMWDSAIVDCNMLIRINSHDVNAFFYRGTAFVNLGQYKEAIEDLLMASKLDPSKGNIWFNLSFAYDKIGNRTEALSAALNAQRNGYKVSDDYFKKLRAK